MRTPLALSVLAISCTLACISCTLHETRKPAFSGEALLLHNGRLIDVENGGILSADAVLFDSSRIRAIGRYDSLSKLLPPGQHVDLGNKFVAPGLWDMHIHLEGEQLVDDNRLLLPVYIAYGITTVRDCASDLGKLVLAWRDSINNQTLFGPRIFTAGRKLEGINSIWKGDLEIGNERELQQMLDTLDNYEVDFIKITENTLPATLFLTSVNEAAGRGYLVTGHVPYELTITELAGAGLSAVEHASYMLRLGSDEQQIVTALKAGTISREEANRRYLRDFSQEIAMAAYRALGARQLAVVPTLIGGRQLAFLEGEDHSRDAFLQYLTQRFTDNYQWRIDRMAGETPAQKEERKTRYELIAGQLPYMQEAGIILLAGSDSAALNTYVYPALALHEELILWQEAGLDPLYILQAATINGARFMGADSIAGSIAPGKEADLLVLNTNPLEDIRATQDIASVVKDGEYLDREVLDSLLAGAREKKRALDLERSAGQ